MENNCWSLSSQRRGARVPAASNLFLFEVPGTLAEDTAPRQAFGASRPDAGRSGRTTKFKKKRKKTCACERRFLPTRLHPLVLKEIDENTQQHLGTG